MKTAAKQQRGMSISSLLLVVILIIFTAIGLMKVIPAYTEDRTIQHILDAIAHDPDMQEAPPGDLRNSYYKRASVNNVTAVNPETINIAKTPTGWVLSAKYDVKIGLAGNMSLLLEFNPSSSRAR